MLLETRDQTIETSDQINLLCNFQILTFQLDTFKNLVLLWKKESWNFHVFRTNVIVEHEFILTLKIKASTCY